MTARRHYLVAYDISDDKRRDQVYKTLLDHGDHAQYSVFFCELNPRELVGLKGLLNEYINQRTDQVIILDLGNADNPLDSGLETLGKAYQPTARVTVV
ncbi:MAG: CRISPR-associated endonuclease Cas2 [Acidimicrobiia bacterium]